VIAWTAAELEKKATNVLAEGCIGDRKRGIKESTSTKQSQRRAAKKREAHKEARTGTRKKLPILRGRSRDNSTAAHEGPSYNERHVEPSESDEDDD
ncbi:hypothetical protein S245_037883, partial [Arachis hypogaea]